MSRRSHRAEWRRSSARFTREAMILGQLRHPNIGRLQAPSRDDRYPSVIAFAEALERALDVTPGFSPAAPLLREGTQVHQARTVRRRRRLPQVIVGAAVALSVGLALVPVPLRWVTLALSLLCWRSCKRNLS
jgi:hypothetical protein